MSRFYNRPENALKRAEELIAVGQNSSGLTLLHEIVMSKRARSTPLSALEPIMLKFVELCVALRKGKVAKEGLHQYKNISQNNSVTTIEVVIKRFIELSEERVADAQAKADKISVDAVEDLEASETPESIILSTVSGEGDKDRTDREVVTPWLKFLWEAYRTALDILRNNARLELLYQSVANQAFQFCLKYTRKTEFRRLCELLRQHLSTAAKYAHQSHAINLNDPDTLQRHLDTRFVQLNAATELQLWQEGFRSVEDIHNLLTMSKKPPKPYMMATYYEKLATIFSVGENYLFHAAAQNKYYNIIRQNKNLSEEEHQRMSSIVLLSALSIPIISTTRARAGGEDENKPKTNRLSNLLRVARAPTRESLLKEALGKTVFSRVKPELKELYQMLELQFHPLSICKKIGPILARLAENKDLEKYIKPLHDVVLTRLLQQLSQVYTTIKISSVVELATFPEPYNYDIHKIEKFVMNGCKKGELSIRINHQTQTLTFETDLFAATKGSISEGPQLQTLPSEQMRSQLVTLAKKLHTAVALIHPDTVESKQESRKRAFQEAAARIEEEHKQTAQRRLLIEKKKELRENEVARKEKEEQRLRQIKQQQEQEAEKVRLEEEAKRRETDRLAQVRAEVEKQEAAKLAAQLAGELKDRNVKMTQEELDSMDADKLRALQIQQLEKEKRELQSKLKVLGKRYDHIERAFRKEEIPLLSADYEEQKRVDRAYHVALRKAAAEAAKTKHQEDVQMKGRVGKIMGDYQKYRAKLNSAREEELREAKARSEEQIARAKEKRIQEFREKKAAAVAKKQREEEERRDREEQDRIREQERAKREEEERANLEARRAEEAERRAKQDEQLRIQQERERAAEEKIARQRESLRSAAPEAPRTPREDGWRRDGEDRPSGSYLPPSRRTGGDAPPSGGKYVPPTRREEPATGGYVPPGRRGDAGPPARGGDERPAAGGWRSREDSGRGGEDRPAAGGWRARAEAAGGEERPATGGWRARQAEAAGGDRAPSTPTQERWRPSGTRYDNDDTRRDREGAPSPADKPAATGGPPKFGSGKWRERVGSGPGSGASSGNEKGSGSDEGGFTPVTRRR